MEINVLRDLTELDIPELLTIEESTQQSPWSEDIFKKCITIGSQGWVIESDHHVIGFVLLLSNMGEGHILNIAVHPDYQHQGHGRQLLNQIMSVAKEKSLTVLFLEVRSSNHQAMALYKKFGFNQVGLRKGYYANAEGREDAFVFVKYLS